MKPSPRSLSAPNRRSKLSDPLPDRQPPPEHVLLPRSPLPALGCWIWPLGPQTRKPRRRRPRSWVRPIRPPRHRIRPPKPRCAITEEEGEAKERPPPPPGDCTGTDRHRRSRGWQPRRAPRSRKGTPRRAAAVHAALPLLVEPRRHRHGKLHGLADGLLRRRRSGRGQREDLWAARAGCLPSCLLIMYSHHWQLLCPLIISLQI
ncbi:hypothetical protein PVAP13_2NG558646 [Panicum virgatum]|uniref:Uncharacterized protein n=1 Tax=Panicum virgatum TaxID=38727 RepID=A0A8T0V5Q6_PANVG|nr:hypothetical protein PVAP13_2NG558646 [Panicum virgatum]